MKLFRTRRRRLVGGTLGVVLVASLAVGTAVAYYGGSGTGSASASAGHAPRTVTVTGSLDAADTPLYPGDVGQVNITVTLTGNGNARVGSVNLDTSQGDQGISGLPAGCLRSWFTFGPPFSTEFPSGSNVTAAVPLELVTGSLTFTDAPVLQDACSDANLTLHLTASPS